MSTVFSQKDIDELRPLYTEVLRLFFGTDLGYLYNTDGTIDLAVVGGDIEMTGAIPGGNLNNCMRMVNNRVTTRLLTQMNETTILPFDYGSMTNNILGFNFSSLSEQTLEDFLETLIRMNLLDDDYIESVLDVKVIAEENELTVLVKYKPFLLKENNISLDISGD